MYGIKTVRGYYVPAGDVYAYTATPTYPYATQWDAWDVADRYGQTGAAIVRREGKRERWLEEVLPLQA